MDPTPLYQIKQAAQQFSAARNGNFGSDPDVRPTIALSAFDLLPAVVLSAVRRR